MLSVGALSPIANAMSGLMSINGPVDGPPFDPNTSFRRMRWNECSTWHIIVT